MSTRKISRNIVKLLVLGAGVFTLLLAPPMLFGCFAFHLPIYLTVPVSLLPFLSIFFSLAMNGGLNDFKGKITAIKYSRRFPLFFYYDPRPNRYRFKEGNGLRAQVQPGDVLLRRHDHYIDGLILSQTSYFTHAGIFYGDMMDKDDQVRKDQVIHAVGAGGVGFVDLESFARCDDIAVLRFEIDPRLQAERVWKPDGGGLAFAAENLKVALPIPGFLLEPDGEGTVFHNQIIKNKNVIKYIEEQIKDDSQVEIQHLGHRELKLFNALTKSYTTDGKLSFIPPRTEYIELVRELANALQGRKYDYGFNFTDSKELSCIEFVWYCYKSLSPLHQVERKAFSYFKWIETFVLVPDLFLKSSFFKLYYSSVHDDNKKGRQHKRLKTFVKKRLLKFWFVVGAMALWQFIILVAIYLFFRYFL